MSTPFTGFCSPAYLLPNVQADCQRCINFYLEVIESGLGKNGSKAQLVPTQGLDPVITGLSSNSRDGYIASNGSAYFAFGSTLYKISTSLVATTVGAIADDGSPVQFADNGIDLFVISSTSSYTVNLTTDVMAALGGAGVVPFSSVAYMDTYIVFSSTGTNQFVWTDPLSNTVPALNFASAEANPDTIVGLINKNQDLWLFGKKTTEIWYNYGQGNTVFAQREGLLLNSGCASAHTIKKINNDLIWLSTSDTGGPILMKTSGYTPERISLYPIEQVWQDLGSDNWARATAFVYQEGGHFFYCLNMPGLDSTWVYDLTASSQIGQPCWHERISNDGVVSFRNIAQGHIFFNGQHLVGGYNDGKLYKMDKTVYTDNGNAVVRERVAPHISDSMKTLFFDRLQLDFLTGSTINLSLDPQIMLQFSDDGGFTWSNEIWETAGRTGAFNTVVQFRRLGSARSRVFKVRVSDGAYFAISGASLDLRIGSH